MCNIYSLVAANAPESVNMEALLSGKPRSLLSLIDKNDPSLVISDEKLEVFYYESLLKKSPFLALDVNPQDEAKASFWLSESIAKTYNENFSKLLGLDNTNSFLQLWRKRIKRVLHRDPILSFDSFTSGATVLTPTGNLPLERVLENTITPELREHLLKSHETQSLQHSGRGYWSLFPFDINQSQIVRGSIIQFVPKTAYTDRLICKEPSVNAFYQRAVGSDLRRLLRERCGIDLSTAQAKHRRFVSFSCYEPSLYTTDDLKMASDIPYIELFRYLLPGAWFAECDASRSHATFVPSSPVWDFPHYYKLEKFVTQGNGFTFELETILFYTLIESIYILNREITKKPLVYGDDLIYLSRYSDQVRRTLSQFGFIVNVDKSYNSGYFRESCGSDYYAGASVRPVFFKVEGKTSLEKIICANQLTERFGYDLRRYPSIRRLYLSICRSIPVNHRCWIPPNLQGGIRTPRRSMWKTRYKSSFLRQRSLDNRLLIQTWQEVPDKRTLTSFSWYARKADPKILFRLASGGFMKGMGFMPGDGTGAYASVRYSGTKVFSRLQESQFSTCASGVDETNPLSVFDILQYTKAPRRLYSDDYLRAVDEDKRILLDRLKTLLIEISKRVGAVNTIDVPFVDL